MANFSPKKCREFLHQYIAASYSQLPNIQVVVLISRGFENHRFSSTKTKKYDASGLKNIQKWHSSTLDPSLHNITIYRTTNYYTYLTNYNIVLIVVVSRSKIKEGSKL